MDQKSQIAELSTEFANNIKVGADHEKDVLDGLEVDIPDKDMFYTYLVLWETWMFFMALGRVNPAQGEEIFNKTLIQTAGILRKITLERFMALSRDLFPLFTNCMVRTREEKLSDVLSTLLYGKENVIDGFDDYVDKVTSTTIDFHQSTIRDVLG